MPVVIGGVGLSLVLNVDVVAFSLVWPQRCNDGRSVVVQVNDVVDERRFLSQVSQRKIVVRGFFRRSCGLKLCDDLIIIRQFVSRL